jgi:hypothetical protein
MRIACDHIVVGALVVYAARMSSAPAGKTVLNQPAYEKSQYGAVCSTSEAELDSNGGSSRMRLRLENVLSSRLTRLGLLRDKKQIKLGSCQN